MSSSFKLSGQGKKLRNVFSAIRHLRFAIIFFAFFFFSLKNSSAQQSTADLIHIGDRIEIDVVGS
ncbi:hypothetical protein P3644_25055, partial [Vibrio parahaemolyticus]|nr:hypothetical protein [Vibrio parahaemolyticus]